MPRESQSLTARYLLGLISNMRFGGTLVVPKRRPFRGVPAVETKRAVAELVAAGLVTVQKTKTYILVTEVRK